MARSRLLILVVFVLMVVSGAASAQEDALPVEPQVVQAEASDGLVLVGDFYALGTAQEGDFPAVLLMHMLGSERQAWAPLIPFLLNDGYNVLTVDLRGHGETGGARDWPLAVEDVQVWLDWLREQPGVMREGVSIIGGSIGSNLALIGCANDPDCVTAIALSPGLDYMGVMPKSAVVEGLGERSALLIASQDDMESANGVRQMAAGARNDIGMRIYPGMAHGTDLFLGEYQESVIYLSLLWLYEHTPYDVE